MSSADNVLFRVRGEPVIRHPDGSVEFRGEATIDADGSPHAYHPQGSPPGLDYLANAGHTGNWWGLACDVNGKPIVQGAGDPAPGFFVSTTSYLVPGFAHGDPRRYLDSERVPFIVVPSPLIRAVPEVVIGCKAMIVDTLNGHSFDVVAGDIGPATHLGEMSIFAANGLSIPSNPKTGGNSQPRRFRYLLWPGVAAPGFRLQPAS